MSFNGFRSASARRGGLTVACASIVLSLGGVAAAQEGGDVPTPSTTAAAASKAPEAKEIIARYVKALGGESAIRKHKSRMMKGEMELPGMGAAPMVIYAAAPDKMVIHLEIPGMGEVKQGFDGKVAWSIDPMGGPNLLPEAQVAQMKDQTDFYGEINFDKRFKEMKSVGESDFDGVKCYAVEMIDLNDGESTYFFDSESGLLRGTTQVQETQMGPMEMTNINKEYKEYSGVKYPVHTEIEVMGTTRVMKFSEVEVDTVKDEVFELPAEIKELVKKRDAAAAPVEPAKPEEPKKENGG